MDRYTFKDLFNDLNNLKLQPNKEDYIGYKFIYDKNPSVYITLEICTYTFDITNEDIKYDYDHWARWRYRLQIKDDQYFKLNATEAKIDPMIYDMIFSIEDSIPIMELPKLEDSKDSIIVSDIRSYFAKIFDIIRNGKAIILKS